VPGAGSAKFGQFGYALSAMVDRPTPQIAPRDRLVAAAPGVTFGGCGNPAVFTTRLTPSGLETTNVLSEPDAAPASFCPQDPNLSDAIDAVPNLVWDATFGRRLASGDFNGDGLADLAATGVNGRTHVFLVTPQGSFELGKSLSNRDFGEPSTELSFGAGLAAGDLNGDGLDELIVGAPLAAIGAPQNVGKAYIYKGCRPVLLDAARAPMLPLGVRPPSHDVAAILHRRFDAVVQGEPDRFPEPVAHNHHRWLAWPADAARADVSGVHGEPRGRPFWDVAGGGAESRRLGREAYGRDPE